jgi:hypothetical protein
LPSVFRKIMIFHSFPSKVRYLIGVRHSTDLSVSMPTSARQAAPPSGAQSVSLSIYHGMYVGRFCVDRKIIIIPKFIHQNEHKKQFNHKPSFFMKDDNYLRYR